MPRKNMSLLFDATNNSISINGDSVSNISADDLSFLDPNILHIYWYDTYGELKYKDESMEFIDELKVHDNLVLLFLEEKKRLKENLEEEKRVQEEERLKQEEEKLRQEEERLRQEEQKDLKLKEYIEKIKLQEEEYERNRDYWEEFRNKRNYRLLKSDWTQFPDSPLTEDQKNVWQVYRQALRDLPENVTDPKALVLDPNHPDWIQTPS